MICLDMRNPRYGSSQTWCGVLARTTLQWLRASFGGLIKETKQLLVVGLWHGPQCYSNWNMSILIILWIYNSFSHILFHFLVRSLWLSSFFPFPMKNHRTTVSSWEKLPTLEMVLSHRRCGRKFSGPVFVHCFFVVRAGGALGKLSSVFCWIR